MTTLRKQKNKIQANNREYYQEGGRGPGPRRDTCELLFRTNFGSERREKLKEFFKTEELVVNRKWCIQLKFDPDLRKMLKQGILKRTREGTWSTKHTVLSLA